MVTLTIHDKMPFGKFKNFPIKYLIENDFLGGYISYLKWAIKTWSNIKFSLDILEAIKKEEEETRISQESHFKINIPKKHYNNSTKEWATECFGIMGDGYI